MLKVTPVVRRCSLLLPIALVCTGVAFERSSAAQISGAQPPQVTFSAEVNFVEVHAIVTDRAGRFVKDLSASDFEILEDGRPQTPSTFALIDLPFDEPSTSNRAAPGVEPDVRDSVLWR